MDSITYSFGLMMATKVLVYRNDSNGRKQITPPAGNASEGNLPEVHRLSGGSPRCARTDQHDDHHTRTTQTVLALPPVDKASGITFWSLHLFRKDGNALL